MIFYFIGNSHRDSEITTINDDKRNKNEIK